MDIDAMLAAYAECAVWAGLDWDSEYATDGNPDPLDRNYSTEDITAEAMEAMREDCLAFAEANASDLDDWTAEQAGHDFWLTRNHHGAGFWDRGLGAKGDRLTKAAHVYGESDLYVGDDGKLHIN